MSSPVPLRAYHKHSSLGDYTNPDTTAPSNSKASAQPYDDELYDPYDPYVYTPPAQGKPRSNTALEESAIDDTHKPSLSYNSKELGK